MVIAFSLSMTIQTEMAKAVFLTNVLNGLRNRLPMQNQMVSSLLQ